MKDSTSIQCPDCKSDTSEVVDSRPSNGRIRRRRRCGGCGRYYRTYEGFDVAHFDRIELAGISANDRTALRHLANSLRQKDA